MKSVLFFFVVSLFFFSCLQQNSNSKILAASFIDSIIKHSDSSYTKPYYRTDFVTASYYLNKKDSYFPGESPLPAFVRQPDPPLLS